MPTLAEKNKSFSAQFTHSGLIHNVRCILTKLPPRVIFHDHSLSIMFMIKGHEVPMYQLGYQRLSHKLGFRSTELGEILYGKAMLLLFGR